MEFIGLVIIILFLFVTGIIYECFRDPDEISEDLERRKRISYKSAINLIAAIIICVLSYHYYGDYGLWICIGLCIISSLLEIAGQLMLLRQDIKWIMKKPNNM
jgi:cytochrome b subunit of formate dehydrogenase